MGSAAIGSAEVHMTIRSWLKWFIFFLAFMVPGAFLGALLWLAGRPDLTLLPSLAAGSSIGLVLAFLLAPLILFGPPTEDRRDRLK
jgi:hypothetical protein